MGELFLDAYLNMAGKSGEFFSPMTSDQTIMIMTMLGAAAILVALIVIRRHNRK